MINSGLENMDIEAIIVYLYHPKMFNIYKRFKSKLEKYFYAGGVSKPAKDLLRGLSKLDKGVSEDGFMHTMLALGFSKDAVIQYQKIFSVAMSYGTDDFNAVFDRVKCFVLRNIIKESIDKYTQLNDPDAFVEDIMNMKSAGLSNGFLDDKTYSITSFADMDPKEMTQEVKDKVIRSSIDIINKSTPLGGYIRGQMSCISAAPGSGKSLLSMRECLAFADPEYQGIDDINTDNDGLHIIYSAFGDLKRYDFMSRMSAQLTHRPFEYVEMNLEECFHEAIKRTSKFRIKSTGETVRYRRLAELVATGGCKADDIEQLPGTSYTKNILLETYLPDKFTAAEYLNHIQTDEYMDSGKTLHEWADVIVIDYDANIRSEEQMYLKGEEIYQTLYQLTFPNKLILMVSQLSKLAWANDIIGLDSLNESSRKQMIIDTMLTLSHPPATNPKNHIGWMNLCKNRRGSLMKCPYFRDLDGNFYGLPSETYQMIRGGTDVKTFIQDAAIFSDNIPGAFSILAPLRNDSADIMLSTDKSESRDEAAILEELDG